MKDFQHEQLFTELTSEEAAVVEGGGSFTGNIDFDYTQSTQPFNVSAGGRIDLISNTFNDSKSNSQNPSFFARIRNVNTNHVTPNKEASVGLDTTSWTDVKAGKYVIDFRDLKDGNYVFGDIKVSYS